MNKYGLGLVIVLLLIIIMNFVFINSEVFGSEWISSQTSWAPVPGSNGTTRFLWSIYALIATVGAGVIIGGSMVKDKLNSNSI